MRCGGGFHRGRNEGGEEEGKRNGHRFSRREWSVRRPCLDSVTSFCATAVQGHSARRASGCFLASARSLACMREEQSVPANEIWTTVMKLHAERDVHLKADAETIASFFLAMFDVPVAIPS